MFFHFFITNFNIEPEQLKMKQIFFVSVFCCCTLLSVVSSGEIGSRLKNVDTVESKSDFRIGESENSGS